jgi:hypothetical protein
MNRIEKQCNPVQGAAFGQTPTLDLQLGPRYRQLLLEIFVVNNYTGGSGYIPTIVDVLDMITLKIGGNPQRTHTAWELDNIHKSYGAQYGLNAYKTVSGVISYSGGVPVAPSAGLSDHTVGTVFYLPIFFREPWRASYAARDMMAWYTSWADGSVLPSLSLELKVPAANATNIYSAGGITINCYAETDNAVGPLDSNKQPVAMITKWKRQGLVYGGAGDLVITTLNKKEIYNQISLFSPYVPTYGPLAAATTPTQILADQNNLTYFDQVTKAKVEVDNLTIRDVSARVNAEMLITDDFNEAALPPDRFDIVFDKSDLPTDGLVMQAGGQTVKDFRITATMAIGSAGTSNKLLQAVQQIYGAIER